MCLWKHDRFNRPIVTYSRATVSIRDLLSWVNFVNVTSKTVDSDGDDKMEADTTGSNRLEPAVAYVHGACMTFLDALGSGKCETTAGCCPLLEISIFLLHALFLSLGCH